MKSFNEDTRFFSSSSLMWFSSPFISFDLHFDRNIIAKRAFSKNYSRLTRLFVSSHVGDYYSKQTQLINHQLMNIICILLNRRIHSRICCLYFAANPVVDSFSSRIHSYTIVFTVMLVTSDNRNARKFD